MESAVLRDDEALLAILLHATLLDPLRLRRASYHFLAWQLRVIIGGFDLIWGVLVKHFLIVLESLEVVSRLGEARTLIVMHVLLALHGKLVFG